jgi:hypothetical protein
MTAADRWVFRDGRQQPAAQILAISCTDQSGDWHVFAVMVLRESAVAGRLIRFWLVVDRLRCCEAGA